jgi:hypothetical protein
MLSVRERSADLDTASRLKNVGAVLYEDWQYEEWWMGIE